MYANHGHLCIALEASSLQIVWFGGQRFAYPKKAILDLSNDVWHAHIRWCMWPGDLLEIWCHEGDSVGTKLCSSISGGWRLFQPFFLGKLVMGLSYGGIPIEIFNFWDAPNFGLFNEFKNTLQHWWRQISVSYTRQQHLILGYCSY